MSVYYEKKHSYCNYNYLPWHCCCGHSNNTDKRTQQRPKGTPTKAQSRQSAASGKLIFRECFFNAAVKPLIDVC